MQPNTDKSTSGSATAKEIKDMTPDQRLTHIISVEMSRQKRHVDRSLARVCKFFKGDMDVLALVFRPYVEAFAEHGDASLPGRGQTASDSQSVTAPTRQSNGDGNGHSGSEAQYTSADSSPAQHGRVGQASLDTQSSRARPAVPQRDPSPGHIAASRKVRKAVAADFWSRSIGGELTIGTATRFDFRQLGRKSHIVSHAVNRIVTELPWPNEDKATLKEVATEEQVKSILDSAYQSLSALEGYPNG